MPGQIQCGPFELVERIGAGSTAVVWQARHRGSGVPVALKLLQNARPRSAFALRNEIRAAARLDHPNIVMLFEQGVVEPAQALASGGVLIEDTAYLAMEWCSGGALSEQRRRVPWPKLRLRLEAMLHALAHAHSRGVIHRDLKPSNVLLCQGDDGEVSIKLTDFGIAHALADAIHDEEEQIDPREGRLSGTLQYMAPEQLAGRWRDEGPWTDLYALGVMAFEAVCGTSPWRAKSRDELLGNLVHSAPPLRSRMPVPEGLQGWVDMLLARDGSQRYQSAAAALEGLRALGEPTIWGRVEEAAPAEPLEALGTPRPPPRRDLALQGIGLSLYGLRPTQIAGREAQRELAWTELIRGIAGEGPRALVLRGTMGVGTSKMASWLSENAHARRGALRLRASHSPIAGPSDGLAAMLRRQLHTGGIDDTAREHRAANLVANAPLPDDSPLEAASLAALLAPPASNATHTPILAEQARTARRCLQRLATRQPIVLTIDNAQWAHNALTLCLDMLDSASGSLPLVMLVLIDSEAVGEASDEAADLERLAKHDRVCTLELAPLNDAEQRQLITNLLGLSPTLVDTVASISQGDALFSASLLRYWVQAQLLVPTSDGFQLKETASQNIPQSQVAVWDAQLDVLAAEIGGIDTESLRHVLEIAAALGESVLDNEWRAACAQAGFAVPDGLVQGLAEINIVTLSRLGWHFRHSAFRTHLRARAKDAGRWETHHRHCATALGRIATHAPGQSAARIQGRVGQHRLLGRQFAEACGPLLRGAINSREASDWSESHRIFDMLAEALREVDDAALTIEAHIERVPCYLSQGRLGEAETLANRALADATTLDEFELQARANMALASIEFARSDPAGATTHLEAALDLLGPSETLWRVQALSKLGSVCMWRRRLAEASRYFRDAQAIVGDDPGYRSERGQILRGMAHLAHCNADYAGATRLMGEARECFETEGNRFAAASCINDLGDLLRHQGQFLESEKLYREALALFESVQAADASTAHCNLGYLLVERGRHQEAEAIFRELLGSALTRERQIDMLWILCGLLACVAAAKKWGEWDELQSQISALAGSELVDEDLASVTRLAAGLARRAGHYERARWAYRYALFHYERMERPEEAATLQELLADLG